MSDVVDANKLFQDLHEVAPKWQTFGVHLKVPYPKVQGIKGCNSIVDGCFMDVLMEWTIRGATIDQLVFALRYPGVDHGRLASEIDKNRSDVDIMDIAYLSERLKSCKAKWFFLGLGLGLKDSDLRKIESDNRSSTGVEICLHNLLIFWLNSDKANLDNLVKALEKVGHLVLAQKLKQKYAGKKFVASTSKPEVTTPVTAAPKLPVAAQYHDTPGPVFDDQLHMKLEMKAHFEITSYLKDLPVEQLKKLGGVLGLYYPSLKKMETYPDDMVEAWLLRQDGVIEVSGEPTFQGLATALEEIGQNGLALDVKQRKHAKRKQLAFSRGNSTEGILQNPQVPYGMQCSDQNPDNQKETTSNVPYGLSCTEASSDSQKVIVGKGNTAKSSESTDASDRIQSDFWTKLLSLFGGKNDPGPVKNINVDKGKKIEGATNLVADTKMEIDKKMVVMQAKDRGEHSAQLKLKDKDTEITTIIPQTTSTIEPPKPGLVGFYPMKGKRHGVALIINNKIFQSECHDPRIGTDRDEYNLIETWRFLGYHIVVLRDCSTTEMKYTFNKIDELLGNVKDVDHDSFVCCILSHGSEGQVYGSDSQPIKWRDIKQEIARSAILEGKPKLFFIQACQGGDYGGKPIEVDRIKPDGDKIIISDRSDFHMSWASVDGDQSFRDTITGSWYIYELCQLLCKHSMVTDLDEIQKMVNKTVVEKYEYKKDGRVFRQQPKGEYTLLKKVFFFHE